MFFRKDKFDKSQVSAYKRAVQELPALALIYSK